MTRLPSASIATFAANGALAQMAQILLLRELLVVLDGDELALGIMLAVWLVWVGLGAAVGTAAMRRAPPGRRYAAVLALAALALPAALLAVRLARPVFDAPLGTPLPMPDAILLALVAAAVPCFCLGMLFPLMVREAQARPAVVYGWEGAGALLAGLVFIFILVGRVPPLAMAGGAGVVAVVAGVWLLGPRRCQSRGPRATLAVAGVVLLGLTLAGRAADARGEQLRWAGMLRGYRLLATGDSPYARYALLESAGQFSLFCNGQHVCDLPDPRAGAFVVHTTLLQHPAPQRVMLVTGDPVACVRETLAHRPARIDCVMLDPLPLRLLRRHLPPATLAALEAEPVRLHEQDPIRFLATTSERYDVILIDSPDPATLGLNRFYTREFFELARDRLRAGGILAITLRSQQNYLGDELLDRNMLVYRTLRSVLPDALATPGDTCLLLARAGTPAANAGPPLTLDVDTLDARREARGVDSLACQALLYSDPFPARQVRAVNYALAGWPAEKWLNLDMAALDEAFRPPPLAGAGPLNSDLLPRAYWATRLANVQVFEPQRLRAFHALPPIARAVLAGALLIGVVTVLSARTAARRRPRGSTAVGLTLACGAVGFAGMAYEVLVLLWFQLRAGQVYVALAGLTAACMAGLAAGSLAADRARRPRALLLIIQGGLVVVGLGLPWALPWGGWAPLAVAVTLAAALGVALGAHFACCAALWPAASTSQGSARALYASDVVGAAVAALLIAAVIIPVNGCTLTAVWSAGFAGLALLATWLTVRSDG